MESEEVSVAAGTCCDSELIVFILLVLSQLLLPLLLLKVEILSIELTLQGNPERS